MSGLELLSGISGVIDIIGVSIKIYNSAQKDVKLSEAFEAVGRRLPVILDTLHTCKTHLEPPLDPVPGDVYETIERILHTCDEKAAKLKQIFENVIPGDHDSWEKRYFKIIKRLGKGYKVEELMISITGEVQILVNNHAVKFVKPEQITELDKIIKEMRSVKSSLPEEEGLGMTFNNSGGGQTNNINSGRGQQINNLGAIGTQNFHVTRQKEDFSFRESAGMCLGRAPFLETEQFIGREVEIDEMKRILDLENTCREQRLLVLGGKGGIGKTQLALSYAKRHQSNYSSVFWLNAASESLLKDSFQSLAYRIFDLQEPESFSCQQLITKVHRWLSDNENREWLLILDNYDDPKLFKIEQYYPSASHGTIIVTTRRPDLIRGSHIPVEPLQDIKDSLKILEIRSRRKATEFDPDARRLAKRLGGLPLALASAGAFLSKSTFTFDRYLQEYEKRWNINPKRPVSLPEYHGRTLYTTWDVSYSHLVIEDPDVAKLLKLLAYFDHANFWYKLFYAGVTDCSLEWIPEVTEDDVVFEGVMRTLSNYCFVEVQEGAEKWSMHNCVHDWTLAGLNKVIDPQQYWYAFDCVSMSIDAGYADEWDSMARFSYSPLAAHAIWLLRDCFCQYGCRDGLSPQRLPQITKVATLLNSQDLFEAAGRYYEWALSESTKTFGPGHKSTLRVAGDIGNLYRKQGMLQHAEKTLLAAFISSQDTPEPDRFLVLGLSSNLAALYVDQGKPELGEQYCKRTLAGFDETALRREDLWILGTINNLGASYLHQGKLELAEQCLERVLAGYMQMALPPDHVSALNTINNLGVVYRNQGKLELAESFYRRSLLGYMRILHPEHSLTLQTLTNLGSLYTNQGKLELAQKFLQRAMTGYGNTIGFDNVDALDTIRKWGNLHRRQGKLELAKKYYQQILANEKVLGSEHTLIVKTIDNLANIYAEEGKVELAEQFYKQALARYDAASQSETLESLETVRNLALVYCAQERPKEAEELFQRVLVSRQSRLGLEHCSTLEVVNDLIRLRLAFH